LLSQCLFPFALEIDASSALEIDARQISFSIKQDSKRVILLVSGRGE
jgi:hypothetical protein